MKDEGDWSPGDWEDESENWTPAYDWDTEDDDPSSFASGTEEDEPDEGTNAAALMFFWILFVWVLCR